MASIPEVTHFPALLYFQTLRLLSFKVQCKHIVVVLISASPQFQPLPPNFSLHLKLRSDRSVDDRPERSHFLSSSLPLPLPLPRSCRERPSFQSPISNAKANRFGRMRLPNRAPLTASTCVALGPRSRRGEAATAGHGGEMSLS